MTAGSTTPGQGRHRLLANVVRRRNLEGPRSERTRRALARRCLFGRPNAADINRMIQDDHSNERQRTLKRYGFDLWLERPVENDPIRTTPKKLDAEDFKVDRMEMEYCEEDKENVASNGRWMNGKSPKRSGRSPKSPRSPKTPRSLKWVGRSNRQLQMTDFWRHRKHSESSSSDKEN